MSVHLYFIEAGPEGAIKIGIGAVVAKRMADFQTGNPARLRVRFTLPYPTRAMARNYERALHKVFAELRMEHQSEWFRRDVDLIEFIQELERDWMDLDEEQEFMDFSARREGPRGKRVIRHWREHDAPIIEPTHHFCWRCDGHGGPLNPTIVDYGASASGHVQHIHIDRLSCDRALAAATRHTGIP